MFHYRLKKKCIRIFVIIIITNISTTSIISTNFIHIYNDEIRLHILSDLSRVDCTLSIFYITFSEYIVSHTVANSGRRQTCRPFLYIMIVQIRKDWVTKDKIKFIFKLTRGLSLCTYNLFFI